MTIWWFLGYKSLARRTWSRFGSTGCRVNKWMKSSTDTKTWPASVCILTWLSSGNKNRGCPWMTANFICCAKESSGLVRTLTAGQWSLRTFCLAAQSSSFKWSSHLSWLTARRATDSVKCCYSTYPTKSCFHLQLKFRIYWLLNESPLINNGSTSRSLRKRWKKSQMLHLK